MRSSSTRPCCTIATAGRFRRSPRSISATCLRLRPGCRNRAARRQEAVKIRMKRVLFGAWRVAAGLARPSSAGNLRRLRARHESLETLVIREANVSDIPLLARLHVTTWNATHAPLLLKGPGVSIREQQWREAFARNDPSWFCFVVQRP